MRHALYILLAISILSASCKGSKSDPDGADSGQVHVAGSTAADSGKYKTSPTETGGQDSSVNGVGSTNLQNDTLKTN